LFLKKQGVLIWSIWRVRATTSPLLLLLLLLLLLPPPLPPLPPPRLALHCS
jgi:hypothetical protein